MRTFKLNKLVRDKIVQFHQDVNGHVEYKILNDKEYLQALQQKLMEEASEIKNSSPDDVLKELADLQEVIDCMLDVIGKTGADLKTVQLAKTKKSGSFKKRHYIHTVTLPDNEYWTSYYAQKPDLYPEILGEKGI